MFTMVERTNSGLEKRWYQANARVKMANFTKQRLRNNLGNPKNIDLYTTMLINMATWSWKTATVGVHTNKMFTFRNRLERITKKQLPLNLLVFNDRINIINQIKKDFVEGRGDKQPFLSKDVTDHATIKVFHSKTDPWGNIEVKDEVYQLGERKDKLYFSTFGSGGKFKDEDIWFDIIIVDEAHHLTGETYMKMLRHYAFTSQKIRWRMPLIILMSATADSIKDVVNDPTVRFGLPEYIASEYSPEIQYQLITSSQFSEQELTSLNVRIEETADIQDYHEKKQEIEKIKEYIEKFLAKFWDLEELCTDLIQRLPSLDKTIIFANSIHEANEITNKINALSWDENTAIALHSSIDEADQDVLDDYNSWKRKIIVAVDKLNEWIDMPETQNVVFWRNTKSPRIFQQQFGRWLRGKKVNFYDYTGALGNMAWVKNINDQISIFDEDDSVNRVWWGPQPRRWINILFGWLWWDENISHDLSIESVIWDIIDLEKTNELPILWKSWQVEIEWKLYQRVWTKTPSSQIWWINWATLKNRINKKSHRRKEKNIRKAKTNNGRIIVTVVESEALQVLIDEDEALSSVWKNGRVMIDKKIYQQVSSTTPIDQLWWLQWATVRLRVNNQPNSRKDNFVRKVKTKGWPPSQAVELEALQIFLKKYIDMSNLRDDGKTQIKWDMYQRIWPKTPVQQLWWIEYSTVRGRIDNKAKDRKRKYVKHAKQSDWRVVTVVHIKQLEIVMADYISAIKLPSVWEDGTVKIEWEIYQHVWVNTPVEQLWWLTYKYVRKKIGLQSQQRKKQHVRITLKKWKLHNVVEINALKSILNDKISKLALPLLWEDGKVKIDDMIYQRVWEATPSSNLFWLKYYTVKSMIDRKDNGRKKKNVKYALKKHWKSPHKKRKNKVMVIEIHALRAILKDKKPILSLPAIWKDGRVSLGAKNKKSYQWVWANTPPSQLWGLRWVFVNNKVMSQSKTRIKKNVKDARKTYIWPNQQSRSQTILVVELKALQALLQKDIDTAKIWKDGRVVIDNKSYQWVWANTPSSQLWWLNGKAAKRRLGKQTIEWMKQHTRKAKSPKSKPVIVVEIAALRLILK